jgi:hypothetical protein
MTVIALAGRRIDAEDADVSRFPAHRVDAVRAELRALFKRLGAAAIVASGASGTDLLGLEIAHREGLPYYIVLPFARRRFREVAVADRPGDWPQIFDEVIEHARRATRLKVLPASEDRHQDFVRTNEWILKQAQQVARQFPPPPGQPPVVAVVVWDGRSRGPRDTTAAFLDLAGHYGLPVYEVLTTANR